MYKPKFIYSVFFFIFLFAGSIVAQTTGKIAGRVVDTEGEPLPGVNVIVEGELKGSATDAEGYYFILNVRSGTYTLSASMIGFKKVSVTDVRVSVDRTTKIDFELEEETFEGEEIVVVAQKKLITKDQTSASAKVSGDEILNLSLIHI